MTGTVRKELDISVLDLDPTNPRFGNPAASVKQPALIRAIVEEFGVDDVISSIAVNGYIEAEPLVVSPEVNGRHIVVEGNRRLAAMLLLSGDDRAAAYDDFAKKYRKLHTNNGSPSYNPVPCIEYGKASEKDLLSYLGVRHIVSTKDWDSYAKAIWINRVSTDHGLGIDDISTMIGDKNNTVKRLLEGFKFMDQLLRAGEYDPAKQSQRRGRGSNASFPFSWVYTILGYTPVRDYLELSDNPTEADLIPVDKLSEAKLLTVSMFGDKTAGLPGAIFDSRELGDLAKIFLDSDKISQLRSGSTVKQIELEATPTDKFITTALIGVEKTLGLVLGRLVSDPPSIQVAKDTLPRSTKVSNLSKTILTTLTGISNAADE
jgi:ParB-like chromosome segregation protein Spo0J